MIKRVLIKIYERRNSLLLKISPIIATKLIYRERVGEKLNLDSPKNFNEKIQWLKLFWLNPLVIQCGDKFGVRLYAEEKGLKHLLPKVYGVYSNPDDIEFDKLPNKFAIKVTSGCGYNIICLNKNKLKIQKVKRQLSKWLNSDYSLKAAEIHYSKMEPRIICEEYIETDQGNFPIDYKVYCFNGEPRYILVTPERETGYKRLLFDLDWNPIDFEKKPSITSVTVNKPSSLDEMLKASKILSKPFPFVRIDFYDLNGKAILGEMTFTPAAGLATHYKEDFSLKLGNMIQLPNRIVK